MTAPSTELEALLAVARGEAAFTDVLGPLARYTL